MLAALLDALRALGGDPRAWALAWARALPVLIIVPAFGLGGLSAPTRVALSLGMALSIAPALHAVAAPGIPFALALLGEAARTLPLALGTAAILWAAVMAGGVIDNLRGERSSVELPVLDESSTPFGALFGLLAALGFLESGGAARLASLLAEPRLQGSFAVAAERLAQSVGVAVAIAAPLVVGSVLIEIAAAFVARAASPAYIVPLVAPVRSLGVLFVLWLVLDRIVELLVALASHVP